MNILRRAAITAFTAVLACIATPALANLEIRSCPSWAEARSGFHGSPEVAASIEERTDEGALCAKDFVCTPTPEANGGAYDFADYTCVGIQVPPTVGCFSSLTYVPAGSLEYYQRGGPTGDTSNNVWCVEVVTDGIRLGKGLGPAKQPCLDCGNPINGSNGNKYQIEVDLAPQDDGGLEFWRSYNSLSGETTAMGGHWKHSWDRQIAAVGDGAHADVVRPDGRRLPFTKVGSQWTPDADVTEHLDELSNNWVLTLPNNDVETYDKAHGRLLSVTNSKGQVTTLAYTDGTSSGANGGTLIDDADPPPGGLPATPPPTFRGLLVSVTDYKGRQLQFSYNRWGRLVRMLDSNGLAYTYQYVVSSQNFVPPARLLGVSYPDGSSRRYVYGETAYIPQFGTQQEQTDFLNAHPYLLTGIFETPAPTQNPPLPESRLGIYKYGFDANSQIKAVSTEGLSDGSTSVSRHSFAYGANYTVTHTDPLGHDETVTFVPVQGVLRKAQTTRHCAGCPGADSNGNYSDLYAYDANGNVASYTDFNGNLTCYGYDTTRDLETSRTEGLRGTCAARVSTSATRTITTGWRTSSRQPQNIAEPLLITSYTYHGDPGVSCAPSGAPTTLVCSKTLQATTDADGSLGLNASADGAARTISYTYNAAGQVLTATGPRSNNVTTYTYYASNDTNHNYVAGDLQTITNALNQQTTFVQYFANGKTKKIVDPNGLETIVDYTQRGWLKTRSIGTAAAGYEVTSYDYNLAGELQKITSADGSTVNYTYDGNHRMTEMKDGLGNRIAYTLDPAGNRTLEQSFDIQATLVREQSREIDVLNRLLKLKGGTNPTTQVTQYGYDGNGNTVSVLDPLTRTTTQIYDARNRLTEVRDPLNGTSAPTKYEYNGRDSLTKVTDPRGLATIYAVNGHGETTSLNSPDTGVTTYGYDAASNLLTKTDSRPVQATYAYDALNRLTTITYPDETVTYTYDSCDNGIGRLCSITDKTGTTSYGYNIKGRVTSKSQVVGTVTQTVQYGYNAAGQLSSVTLPSGRQFTYGYSNNRVFSIAMTMGGTTTTILDGVFYEPFGPNGGWRWGNSTQQVVNTHTRLYDKDFRTLRVTSDLPASGSQPVLDRLLAWDAQSRVSGITDLGNSAFNATYGYDLLDRITSATQGAASWGYVYDGVGNRTSTTVNSGSSTTYTPVPASNRLASLSGAQSKTYQYDAAGNMTSDGSTTWAFGGNNRPTQAGATTFLINALGQRVKKGSGASAVRFLYDESGRLLGEYDDSGNALRENVWLDDLPVAVIQ